MKRKVLSTSVLLLALALSRAAAAPYATEEDKLWVAGNKTLEIALDKRTGTLERLLDKQSQEDYCNQNVSGAVPARRFVVGRRLVGLVLLDELRKREFSDLRQTPRIRGFRAGSGENSVYASFSKEFSGAEFIVEETYTVFEDHVRWDVRVHKTRGPDRTLRVIQLVPLPLGSYEGWAPVSDAPFSTKPYRPFAIEYGQSVSGAVGEVRWRTLIPMVVFYSSRTKRAISITHPFEVPAVRIRFLSSTSARADFHWNSRKYPPEERPYLQVVNEYLGLRDGKDLRTSLLIASHPANWRPALGWVYSHYREYFDPDPGFDPWDGVYVTGYDLMKDSYTEADLRRMLEGRRRRGARWEEQHGHFPWYGLMIPGPSVRTWMCESHRREGYTNSRAKIAAHARRNREFGIGTFIYYNLTEAEHWYAEKEFPESIARDEQGEPIGAYRADRYPDPRACLLMNADPSTPFGRHMIAQAKEMVEAYPAIAGFFWDVYGRSYMFDFAHDDGITMVNNKPAYYIGFMYERMMREHIGPLLHGRGMCITANKPTSIVYCKGLDGVMARESTPEAEVPPWIAAESFTGLSRHVMILDGLSGTRAEKLLLNCLRYGMFYSDIGTVGKDRKPLPRERVEANAALAARYLPFIQRFRGKKWIFYPRALELPRYTGGNIFRLRDGSVMVTMVSYWRAQRRVDGFFRDLRVICRLPDAGRMKHAYAVSLDAGRAWKIEPRISGDTLTFRVPQHGKGTVILLSPRPDKRLEAMVSPG